MDLSVDFQTLLSRAVPVFENRRKAAESRLVTARRAVAESPSSDISATSRSQAREREAIADVARWAGKTAAASRGLLHQNALDLADHQFTRDFGPLQKYAQINGLCEFDLDTEEA